MIWKYIKENIKVRSGVNNMNDDHHYRDNTYYNKIKTQLNLNYYTYNTAASIFYSTLLLHMYIHSIENQCGRLKELYIFKKKKKKRYDFFSVNFVSK